MASALKALQGRVNAIRATGNDDLAARTFLVIGRELRAYFNKKQDRRNFHKQPYHWPFTQQEVDWRMDRLRTSAASLRVTALWTA